MKQHGGGAVVHDGQRPRRRSGAPERAPSPRRGRRALPATRSYLERRTARGDFGDGARPRQRVAPGVRVQHDAGPPLITRRSCSVASRQARLAAVSASAVGDGATARLCPSAARVSAITARAAPTAKAREVAEDGGEAPRAGAAFRRRADAQRARRGLDMRRKLPEGLWFAECCWPGPPSPTGQVVVTA